MGDHRSFGIPMKTNHPQPDVLAAPAAATAHPAAKAGSGTGKAGSRIRVSVVDDDPDIGDLVGRKLRRLPEFEFLAAYASGQELFRRLPAAVPDVLLVDILLPEISGIQILQWLAQRHPEVRTVVLSGSEQANHVVQALEAGAQGYLVKPLALDALPGLLQDVMAGRSALDRRVADFLVRYFNHKGMVGIATEQLTAREKEIIGRAAAGCSDKEGAEALGLSVSTYKNHLHNIYERLGVASKQQALERLKGSCD